MGDLSSKFTAYVDGAEIRLIVENVGMGEYGSALERYFFDHDEFFYFTATRSQINFETTVPDHIELSMSFANGELKESKKIVNGDRVSIEEYDSSQVRARAHNLDQLARSALAGLPYEKLKNASYHVPEFESTHDLVTLNDGRFIDQPNDDSPAHQVAILSPLLGSGDLNGDGVTDAAVMVVVMTSSGSMYHNLRAIINDRGVARDRGGAALGDRVQVESMSISEGEVSVDLLTHAPDDPQCCPTVVTKLQFRLEEDRLVPYGASDE